jgi:hypothetical protein
MTPRASGSDFARWIAVWIVTALILSGVAIVLAGGCGPDLAHAAIRQATPGTLAAIETGVRAGDVVQLAPGAYSTLAPPADGVTYIGDVVTPARVKLGSRLTFSRSATVVRGVDATKGVSFAYGANDTISDSHIGSDAEWVEADGCAIQRATMDVSGIWHSSRTGTTADSLIPSTKIVGGLMEDVVVHVQGVGSGHLFRLAGCRGFTWRRVHVTGRTSTVTGNSLLKLFDCQRVRFEDCDFDVENACISGCDESGNVVLRDRTLETTFLRTSIRVWGKHSDFWLTASGMAGNSETNQNNTFDRCMIRNETSGQIRYQNTMTGDTLIGTTFIQRSPFGINGCGFTAAGASHTPSLIRHCTFLNVAGGPALAIGDGFTFTAQLRMAGNIFASTGPAAALGISPEMCAGKLAADSSLAWSGWDAAHVISFWRSCCGAAVSGVGLGSAWTAATGLDQVSRFGDPDSAARGPWFPDGYAGAAPPPDLVPPLPARLISIR